MLAPRESPFPKKTECKQFLTKPCHHLFVGRAYPGRMVFVHLVALSTLRPDALNTEDWEKTAPKETAAQQKDSDNTGKTIKALAVKVSAGNVVEDVAIALLFMVFQFDQEKGVVAVTPQQIAKIFTFDTAGTVATDFQIPPVSLEKYEMFVTLSVNDAGVEKKGLPPDTIIRFTTSASIPFEGTHVASHLVAPQVCSNEANKLFVNEGGVMLLDDAVMRRVLPESDDAAAFEPARRRVLDILNGSYRPYKDRCENGVARCIQRMLSFTSHLTGTTDGKFGGGSNNAYTVFLKTNDKFQLIDTNDTLINSTAITDATIINVTAAGLETLLIHVKMFPSHSEADARNAKIRTMNKNDTLKKQ